MESITRNKATAAEIQRLEDGPLNPLTQRAWPVGHDAILQTRRSLPVYGQCQHILDTYHNNGVFVLTSGTGSGKSTQIPQFLVYDEYGSDKLIACTQPRRLAATSVAARVAGEMGVVLGEEVGYQIGGDAKISKGDKGNDGKGKTRLAYVTEGSLLAQLHSDHTLSKYACVLIDEAHERTVEADLLMGILKKVLKKRSDFKVC